MTRKKRQRNTDDPFTRACSCGAAVGEPCRMVGKDDKPLATRATRLVHAARLDSAETARRNRYCGRLDCPGGSLHAHDIDDVEEGARR